MAGLACADALWQAGHDVSLFDKGRGAGGRMSTRRLQTALGEVSIDYGAQYFTARDPQFVEQTKQWQRCGVAEPWPSAAADAWVGVPSMNAVIRHMAMPHQVSWGDLVTALSRDSGRWSLTSFKGSHGPFDGVIVAVPAEQAAPILSLHDFAMARSALLARSQPCWTGLFVFDHPLEGLPAILRDCGTIAWAARNNAKPGRSGVEAWVVQGSADWSTKRLDEPPEEIAALLLAALADASARMLLTPVSATAHRWRFALSGGIGSGAMWNPDLRLGACGDWLLGPRVECAWLSGRMLAGKILQDVMLPAIELH